MTYSKDQIVSIVYQTAHILQLDPILLCALIETESSWNPHAQRYESNFWHTYQPDPAWDEAEKAARATSYGLMQILGQTARELGFEASFELLFDPEVNLEIGCKKLIRCLERHDGDVQAALLSYNGGGDHTYPYRVLAKEVHYGPTAPIGA